MKTLFAILLPLIAFSPSVADRVLAPAPERGPYHFTVPVPELKAGDAEAVTAALLAEFGERTLLEIQVHAGALEFYAGGDGPDALFRLSHLERALATEGFSLHRRPWTLRGQALGLRLSSKGVVGGPALGEAIAGIPGATVLGTLLDHGRMVLVVEFEETVRWSELSKQLAASGVSVDDMLWGHWKYGWGLEPSHHSHACGVVTSSSHDG